MIVRINGGLGNQMFQYAFGKAMEYKLNNKTYYDLGWLTVKHKHRKATDRPYELPVFAVLVNQVSPASLVGFALRKSNWFEKFVCWLLFTTGILHLLREKEEFTIDTLLVSKINNRSYIKGCFQTENYFRDYEKEIRKDFTFVKSLSANSQKYSQLISKCNAVSIHIRRGDYVKNKQINAFHGTCSNDYYQKAIDYITEHTEAPFFFIFSDDLEWVERQPWISQINKAFIEGNSGAQSYEDMHLMSLCKHQIIANSSFSWWGAWLNKNPDKIVIAPSQWLAQPEMNKKVKHLIPDTWIKI